MTDPRFDIQFQGKLVTGSDPETVKTNLMRLFKIDEARAAAMLSGKTVTLKKDADQATAMKFRAALKQAGALCDVIPLDQGESEDIQLTVAQAPVSEPVSSPATPTPMAAPVANPPSNAAPAATGDLQTVGTIRTGGEGFTGAFSVAPVGADMDQAPDTRPAAHPDISGLSLAPAGADLGQKKADAPPPPPDVSGLSLQPEK